MLVGFLATLIQNYWYAGINWVLSILSLGPMLTMTQRDENLGYLGRIIFY